MLPISVNATVYIQTYGKNTDGAITKTTCPCKVLDPLTPPCFVCLGVLMGILIDNSTLSGILVYYPPALILESLMNELQCLKGHHGSDSGRNGTDHVGAHTVIEGSPAFFMEYNSTSIDDAAISRHVNHAVRRRGSWRTGLMSYSVPASLKRDMIVRVRRKRTLLCLQSRSHDFMRVRC